MFKNISTLIINKKNITFGVDKNLSIAKSLYEADIVIGGETYAMVLALKLKKKVYSYLPIKNYPFNLPFKKIEKI